MTIFMYFYSSDSVTDFFGLAPEANFKRQGWLANFLGVVIRDHNKISNFAGPSTVLRRI